MHDENHDRRHRVKRRRTLSLLATAGAVLLAARAVSSGAAQPAPMCVLSPAQTEGPYFIDERLNRSDIRSDPTDGSMAEGAPLTISLAISAVTAGKCAPLAGATVDIWHCDANGRYSDTRDPGFDTTGKKFLRGFQVTDGSGTARFTTIYPGWYAGRAVHIHFKVRGGSGAKRGFEFTSQFYFDDAVTDRVYVRAPYAKRGRRTVRNGGDAIFRDGGNRMILPVTESSAGYAADFNVGVMLA